MLWANDALFGLRHFAQVLEYKNIEQVNWTDGLNKGSQLAITQLVPLKNVPFCKQTNARNTVEIVEYEEGKVLVLQVNTTTIEAPYSDTFCCKELYVALSPSKASNKCIFSKFMKVEFSKHTMLKSKITKAALENMTKISEQWLDILNREGYSTGKYKEIKKNLIKKLQSKTIPVKNADIKSPAKLCKQESIDSLQ